VFILGKFFTSIVALVYSSLRITDSGQTHLDL
jgi:hypothetical protein